MQRHIKRTLTNTSRAPDIIQAAATIAQTQPRHSSTPHCPPNPHSYNHNTGTRTLNAIYNLDARRCYSRIPGDQNPKPKDHGRRTQVPPRNTRLLNLCPPSFPKRQKRRSPFPTFPHPLLPFPDTLPIRTNRISRTPKKQEQKSNTQDSPWCASPTVRKGRRNFPWYPPPPPPLGAQESQTPSPRRSLSVEWGRTINRHARSPWPNCPGTIMRFLGAVMLRPPFRLAGDEKDQNTDAVTPMNPSSVVGCNENGTPTKVSRKRENESKTGEPRSTPRLCHFPLLLSLRVIIIRTVGKMQNERETGQRRKQMPLNTP